MCRHLTQKNSHDLCRHEDGLAAKEGRHGFVHDAVCLNEADARLGELGRVHFAPAWAGRGLLDFGHWKPVGTGRFLLLESPLKRVQEVTCET